MEFALKTLTPLWTGGVETGKVDRIHETGILGSLRWWYEALVRGLGGDVCQPTAGGPHADRCPRDDRRYCHVCQLFGATGWRRRFRLVVQDSTTPDPAVTSTMKANRSYTDTQGRRHTPTWYFPPNPQDNPKSGTLTIHIQSLAHDFSPEVIGGLLQFMADWGTLGARTQMGFGVMEPVHGRFDTHPLYDWLLAAAGQHQYPQLPSLHNLFLARIQRPNATDQETFNLKYDLRQLFSGLQHRHLRHFIMGTVQGGRMATKVKMSRPYGDGLMRVWGWIPEEASVYQGAWDRNAVVQAMYRYLHANYNVQVWREMHSPRDTIAPNSNDASAFLRRILELEEEGDAA
jgi:CRISPR-associated protein Cmr1